jgi:glyoxylase-like metal-dependent hydrolase (beta-lactamase superfamily II)
VPISILNVGFRSTNYWVVSAGRSRLLVDLGWPGMLAALESELKRKDVPLAEITHGIATHYHMDHAGAAQDLKNRGMRLVVTTEQLLWIAPMAAFMKPTDRYTPIVETDNLVIRCQESRALLATLGIAGQIVHTPGHSEDSVSLVLDSGEAFTGDLTVPQMADETSAPTVHTSWQRLRDAGAKQVYAGHGPVRPMPS